MVKITINKKEIVYGSDYELNGVPEGYIDHSLGPLAERMLELERKLSTNKIKQDKNNYC